MVSALVLLAIGWSSPDAKAYNAPSSVYLFGVVNGMNKWENISNLDEMKQMTKVGDNAWELKLTNSGITKFKICSVESSSNNWYWYAANTDANDVELTSTTSNQGVWKKGESKEGKCFYGDLQNKYIYVTWKNEDNAWTIAVKDNSSLEIPGKDFWLYVDNDGLKRVGKFTGSNGNYSLTTTVAAKTGKLNYFIVDADRGATATYNNNNNDNAINGYRWSSGSYDDITNKTVSKNITKSDSGCFYTEDQGAGKATFSITWDGTKITSFGATVPTGTTPQPGTGLYVYKMHDKMYTYITTLTQGTDGIWKNETPVEIEAGKLSYCLNTVDFGASGNDWNNFGKTRYNPNGTNVDITDKPSFTGVGCHTDGSFDVNPEATSNVTFYAQVSNGVPTGVRVSVVEKNPMKKFWLYRRTISNEWIKVGHFKSTDGANYSISGNFKKTEGKTYYMVVDADNGSFTYWDDMILNGSSRWAPSAQDADITNQPVTAISKNGNYKYYTEYTADGTATFNLVWDEDGSKVSSLQGVVNYTIVEFPETTLYLYRSSDGTSNYDKVGEFRQVGSNADYSILVDYNNQNDQYVISTENHTGSVNLSSFTNLYAPNANDNYHFQTNKSDLAISQVEKGKISFHNDANQALVVVSWTKDNSYNKMSVYYPATYYFSGDINGWASLKKYGDAMNIVTEEALQPYKFELDQENPGWYILNLRTDLHGQFQILKNGDFHAAHYTNRTVTTNMGNTYDKDYNDDTTDKGKKYWSSWVPTKAEFDLNNESGKMNMFSGENTGLNLFINHNFYSDVTLHFKPAGDESKNNQDGLIYLQGVPRDIYVYYYNQDNPDGETISIKKNDGSAMNSHNYYYNEKKLLAAFEEHELTPAEKLLPGLQSFVRNTEAGTKLRRLPVPVGVETEFWADKTKFFYQWNLQGSGKVSEKELYTFLGSNIYIIYCGDNALARVLFNLVREDHNDPGKYYDTPSNNVDMPWKAVVRFMDIDINGNAQFQKADGTYTKNRSEAVAMPLTEYIHNGKENDGHKDESFSVPEGVHGSLQVYDPAWTKWHYTYKDWSPISGVSSVVARKAESAGWHNNVYAVSVGNGNRDIEIEVKLLQTPNGAEWTDMPAMYFSDYKYNAYDSKYSGAIATGTPTTRLSTNNYKLNNDKLFAVAALPANSGITTAVDKIGEDVDANAEVVYYNLQGLRVEKPTNGIFIKVQGKKATKVRF